MKRILRSFLLQRKDTTSYFTSVWVLSCIAHTSGCWNAYQVAGRGALRIEKLGHKLGYRLKDANGDLAPIVEDDESTKIPSRVNAAPSEAETLERSRLGAEVTGRDRAVSVSKLERGFGAGYSPFAEELHTGTG
jgi:hypothetical protein